MAFIPDAASGAKGVPKAKETTTVQTLDYSDIPLSQIRKVRVFDTILI